MAQAADHNTRLREERGVTMIEYLLVAAILVLIFIAVNEQLFSAGQNRAEQSANVVGNMAPCGGRLTNMECY